MQQVNRGLRKGFKEVVTHCPPRKERRQEKYAVFQMLRNI
jgi:hypothetical protein